VIEEETLDMEDISMEGISVEGISVEGISTNIQEITTNDETKPVVLIPQVNP
jgi:hypothetical protein